MGATFALQARQRKERNQAAFIEAQKQRQSSEASLSLGEMGPSDTAFELEQEAMVRPAAPRGLLDGLVETLGGLGSSGTHPPPVCAWRVLGGGGSRWPPRVLWRCSV